PIEQRGSRPSNVQIPARRRRKPDPRRSSLLNVVAHATSAVARLPAETQGETEFRGSPLERPAALAASFSCCIGPPRLLRGWRRAASHRVPQRALWVFTAGARLSRSRFRSSGAGWVQRTLGRWRRSEKHQMAKSPLTLVKERFGDKAKL